MLVADGALLERHDELRDLPWRVVIVAADVAAETVLGRRADVMMANVRDDVVEGLAARSRMPARRLAI